MLKFHNKREIMCRTDPTKEISRIFNHLLRIITLIIIGCPGMNDGLSSLQSKANFINHQDFYLLTTQQSTTVAVSGAGGATVSNPLAKINHIPKDNNMLNSKKDESMAEPDNNMLENIYNLPMEFGTENSTVVTTQIGATAHLPCTIHHIGEGVVSWIRRKDYHLLTVGLTTYSSDERYSATHLKHSEDWTLQIKFVQLRDAGIHECQVSTHPPTSIFIHLNVVEARAIIRGEAVRYLTPGSTLKLNCCVEMNTETSAFLFWYHDNRMINYDVDRGINVSTEADNRCSELTISRAKKEHSGNYTCVPSNAQPASVLIHIFKGDVPAAMYHDHRGRAHQSYQINTTLLVIMLIIPLIHVNLLKKSNNNNNCLR